MSYLSERSIILENWMFFAPILLAVVIYFYVNDSKKSATKTNISTNETQKLKLLGESEYIGEYQDESTIDEDEYAPFLKEDEHIPFSGAKITLDGGAAKFYEIANDRRSVRKYSRKNVDFAVIEKCIQAAGKFKKKFLTTSKILTCRL